MRTPAPAAPALIVILIFALITPSALGRPRTEPLPTIRDATPLEASRPHGLLMQPAGDTVCVYWQDFQEDYLGNEGGWTAFDADDQAHHWKQSTYDAGDGLGSRGIAWCGDSIPAWAGGSGYGNTWTQYLTKDFTLGPDDTEIVYLIQYDTEDDYDFVYLRISDDGGENYSTLETWDAISGGFVRDTTDISFYCPGDVKIQFMFASDGSFSDEDNQYDGDGAVRLDSVQVTNHAMDDFETPGDLDGWASSSPSGSGLSFSLVASPPCDEEQPCPSQCWTWSAGDSFPSEAELGTEVEIGIESPVIDVPADADFLILQYDVYLNLPSTNYVYVKWQVAAPPVEQGGSWQSDASLYYGNSGFSTIRKDLALYVTPGADKLKIRLIGMDGWTEYGAPPGNYSGHHTAAPMFDNIAVLAVGTDDPGLEDWGTPDFCADDSDGDGVFGSSDLDPAEDASFFDSNGDGVIDDGAGARHLEYWNRSDFPLSFKCCTDGAPGISDGSDIDAVEDAMAAWTSVADIVASVDYAGTDSKCDPDATDMNNVITFTPSEWLWSSTTIAVGISTSFLEPTWANANWWRPGQISDVDVVFNPLLENGYRTDTGNLDSDIWIESVAAHEFGHFFGLVHTPVKSSTMFPVIQPDNEAATLEAEDSLAMFKAYGDSAVMANAGRLSGTVTNGYTGNPLPGAAVFAISDPGGDTLVCEYTLPDGRYTFVGLPDGDYNVAIHPLDASSSIGYLDPYWVWGNHPMMADTVVTQFVPEYWDLSESAYDDAEDRDALAVTAGSETFADFTTNIDETGPVVLSTVPDTSAVDVPIDASVLIMFSESINDATIQGNFSLVDTTTQDFVLGNAVTLKDDSLLAFVPMSELSFSSTYRLKLEPGLEDMYGNGLADTFVTYYRTEVEPPVSLASLSPNKGVMGMVVSLNGKGFDPEPTNNTVSFNGTEAVISSASATQLVVTVPDGATSGPVNVYNHIQDLTSNDLQFAVLQSDEVPRGFVSNICQLGAVPRDLAVLPDGDYVFVATDEGVEAVNVDPGSGNYMSSVAIPVADGLSNLAVGPANNRLYGVSSVSQKLYRFDATEGSMDLLSEKTLASVPRGIVIDPGGHRAYIPTDDGDIQIWDINELSPSFEIQIGHIQDADPDLRGELSISASGDILLGLTGTGKMIAADLDSGAIIETTEMGIDPEDVAIDPLGDLAYVCDGMGYVRVASMDDYQSLWTIRTGGDLQGISITPAGSFAIVVDRQINKLSAIDLRSTSTTYLSVVATVLLPVNPVDIELSPDGDYAYTISEAEENLVATTLGVGPSLSTISRAAGPDGAMLVLTGSDFESDTTRVFFGSTESEPERLEDSTLTVVVPAGASSGEVLVGLMGEEGDDLTSNSIYFEVLGPTEDDMLRPAAYLPGTPSTGGQARGLLKASADGSFMALADEDGGLHILVSDYGDAQYHQFAGSAALGSPASDIAITPDGRRIIAVLPGLSEAQVIGSDRLSQDYLSLLGTIDFSGVSGSDIAGGAISPDGRLLLVSDPGAARVHFVDIVPGSATEYEITASVTVSAGAMNGAVHEMDFHPSGEYAYLAVHDSDPAVVLVLDTRASSATYQSVVYTADLPGSVPQEWPVSLSFTPCGDRCLVLTSQEVSSPSRTAHMLDSSTPAAPTVSTSTSLGGTAAPVPERIDVSPRGDRAIAGIRQLGLINLEIQTDPDTLIEIQQAGQVSHHLDAVDGEYSPAAGLYYCLSESSDTLSVFDFSEAASIALYSGNNQEGVVNEELPMALKLLVTGASGAVQGVPVEFRVTSGGGFFAETDTTIQTVSTNADGVAGAWLTLGPDTGPGSQTVQASATGLSGSPCTFTADGVVDPLTLPLSVTTAKPDSGATGVSLSTTAKVAFSRPVNPETVNDTSFFLHDGDLAPLPAVIGFAHDYTSASLTPRYAYSPSSTYWMEATTGIEDESGGHLEHAVSVSFDTEARPDLAIGSIKPLSGPELTQVVFSGAGFDEDLSKNRVIFDGTIYADVTGGGVDYLIATVPAGTPSCSVYVEGTWTYPFPESDRFYFTVIPDDPERLNNVVGSTSTGSATRSVSITPDGAIAYAVSPDGDNVSVIDLLTPIQIASIAVGSNPVAVAIDPEGTLAYVANYIDGTASVIDISTGSPTYNEVVDVLAVGIGPTDLAITPDGDRLVVANSVSGTISGIDTDPQSETFRSVVSSTSTGAGARTVAITPDGGLIYVGTASGYTVISGLDYGVVGSTATGSATRTVAITPDGGMLVLLTTEGVVNIYDIAENSDTQNQVVGTIKVGSGTSTVAISPDGGALYMIQEAGDVILVGMISLNSAFGVRAHGVEGAPLPLEITVVDTLVAGEDPACVALDPTGTGKLIVTNAGDCTVTLFGEDPLSGADPVDRVRQIRNYPNPFSGLTTIKFAIPEAVRVQLAVYDIRGRLVANVLDRTMEPGIHTAVWNGTDRHGKRVASGLYFCRMVAGDQVKTRKMMMLR
jgi:YVTN family beta-propeller protein